MKNKSLIFVLFSALALSGCIYVNDTDDDRHEPGSGRFAQPTIGQEIMDLDRARASGVINGAEYDRAKQAILSDI